MAGKTRTDRIVKQFSSKQENRTPIANEMYLPNHSGDHSKGRVLTTPTTNYEFANKLYVDNSLALITATLPLLRTGNDLSLSYDTSLTANMAGQLSVDIDNSTIVLDVNSQLSVSAAALDHGALLGLADDDHTQYLLLAGRSGSQTAIGGTGVTDFLALQSTSGIGTTDHIKFLVGNNGATEAMRILNSGFVGVKTTNPLTDFDCGGGFRLSNDAANVAFRVQPLTGTGKNRSFDFVDSANISNSGILSFGNAPTVGWFHTSLTGAFIQATKLGTGTTPNLYIQCVDNASSSNPSITLQKNTFRVGIGGITVPTAILHLVAGTATANTAPLKFNSGTLLTTPEAGAVEFLTDKFYGTITTGAARRTFAMLESGQTFSGANTFNGNITMGDSVHFEINPTNGTKFGLSTSAKMGWYNSTPVVQATTIADADGTLADITTKFNSLLSKFETYGFLASA